MGKTLTETRWWLPILTVHSLHQRIFLQLFPLGGEKQTSDVVSRNQGAICLFK